MGPTDTSRGLNSAEDLAQHVLKLPSAGVSACELLSDGIQALPFHVVAAGIFLLLVLFTCL